MPQEKFANALPVDWDGRMPFTNPSNEDFFFTWSKKQYLLPTMKTVDMMKMGMNQTPLEVQQIRKFAAKQLAEREFFNSDKAKKMQEIEKDKDGNSRLMSWRSAAQYNESDLKSYIQACLTPLPEASPLVAPAQMRNTESELHVDQETGENVSVPIKNATQSVNNKPGMVLVN